VGTAATRERVLGWGTGVPGSGYPERAPAQHPRAHPVPRAAGQGTEGCQRGRDGERGLGLGTEPGGPSPRHAVVPVPRVVTEECYPFSSPESPRGAQPCMMHSRSTGRGKRQATARCPNPQTHANDIYQSTPAYRLASSVSCPPGGRSGSPAAWGAGRGSARFAWESQVGKPSWEKPAGELLLRPASPHHPPMGAEAASARSPEGWGGSAGGPGPATTQLSACRRRRS